MTRLYYQAGLLRLKIIIAIFLCMIFFGGTMLVGYARSLALPPTQARGQLFLVSLVLIALWVLVSAFAWVYLRPVARLLQFVKEHGASLPMRDEAARTATLRFPVILVSVALGLAVASVASAALVNLLVIRLDPILVAGSAIGTFAVALVACAYLYLLSRILMRPVTAHFRHEELPPGRRVSIRSKLTLIVMVIAVASAVLPALICARRVELTLAQTRRDHKLHLAEVLAYSGTAMQPERLGLMLGSIHLSSESHIRLSDLPGPTTSPLPPDQVGRYVEVVASPRALVDWTVMATIVALLLGLAAVIGHRLALSISQDVTLVTRRISALARADANRAKMEPLVSQAPQFGDLQRLAAAVNELLVRIADIHVAHFVAIEKTLAAEQVKMQFLANVSHDLRSPLNSVLGFSELLLRELPADGGRPRQAIERIFRAGTELLWQIDEVLDLAKLEAGRLTLHREDSLPAEIVRRAMQDAQRHPVPEGVRVNTELQAGLPMVWVDADRLAQALSYLVRFSIDSMHEGEVIVRVTMETLPETSTSSVERRRLHIRVADTSPGLEGEEVTRLFFGFRRKPGVRGLGLGLPLAKAFIEMHGGTMQVFSTPGVGTTFAIELPAMQRRAMGRLRPVPV